MDTELLHALIAYIDAKVDYEVARHELGNYHDDDITPDRGELREAEQRLNNAIKENN